jgi:hypothetical protein
MNAGVLGSAGVAMQQNRAAWDTFGEWIWKEERLFGSLGEVADNLAPAGLRKASIMEMHRMVKNEDILTVG